MFFEIQVHLICADYYLPLNQYLRRIIRRVITPKRARVALAIAIAICLGVSAPALGAPAGDEYLPAVPKAAGKELATGQNAGGTVLVPAARGAQENGGDRRNAARKSRGAGDSAQSIDPASSSSDSSGTGALLDPIILLVIAGVVAATAGIMLRRRGHDTESPAAAGDASARASARPTPVGKIVNGGEEAPADVPARPSGRAGSKAES